MASDNVLIVDDNNFESEVLNSDTKVLIDFHAVWCAPCKALTPVVEQVADELVGQVKVAKLDIDQAPKTAMKYGVQSIPTLMVFEGGEKKAEQKGVVKKAALVKMLGL